VDIAARSYIAEQGYGDYFNHRVGHGIGLDTHEFFSVNTGVKDRIEIGNVFSVEPGIYIPDKLGIRIESLVAIHDDGPRLLHQLPVALRTFQ
jgi:Xaa-Pro aminopeptidase